LYETKRFLTGARITAEDELATPTIHRLKPDPPQSAGTGNVVDVVDLEAIGRCEDRRIGDQGGVGRTGGSAVTQE